MAENYAQHGYGSFVPAPDAGSAVGQQVVGTATAGFGQQKGMQQPIFDPSGKYTVKYEGAYAAVEVFVGDNDGLKAEGGAMITLSESVDIDAKTEGGLATALCLGCCTNESLFFSHFRKSEMHILGGSSHTVYAMPDSCRRRLKHGMGGRGDVLLAPGVPGEIIMLHLDGRQSWAIQKGGFMCCDQGVNIGVISQGLAKGCCSGMGFFIMEASGVGRLLLASFGSIVRYDVAPGEVRTIDNGFVVAWTTSMDYKVGLAASTYSASLFSGEGFVTRFTGPGTVYVQTRSIKSLAGALRPYLPAGGGGGG